MKIIDVHDDSAVDILDRAEQLVPDQGPINVIGVYRSGAGHTLGCSFFLEVTPQDASEVGEHLRDVTIDRDARGGVELLIPPHPDATWEEIREQVLGFLVG